MPDPIDRTLSPDALVKRAQIARASGDWGQAERCLAAAAVVAPERPIAYVNYLGVGLNRSPHDRIRSIEAWLGRLRTLTGAEARITRNLSMVATHSGLHDRSASYLRKTLASSPDDAAAWRALSQHRAGPAIARLIATMLNPADVELLKGSVFRAAGRQDWASVMSFLRFARDVDMGDEPGIVEGQADALLALGQFDDALNRAEASTRERPTNRWDWLRLGLYRRTVGSLDAGEVAYKRAIVLQPGFGDALSELGRLRLQKKASEAALRSLTWAQVAIGKERISLLKNRAAALASLRRGDDAKPLLQRLMVVTPDDVGLSLNLSTAEQFRLDFDAAERWVRRTLALSPENIEAQLNGALMSRYAGRYETALRRFNIVLARDPENPKYRYNRAGLELQDGSISRGLEDFHYRHRMDEFSTARRLFPTKSLPQPVWDMTPAPNARLAIWGEQGVGDEIWFSQYLNEVRGKVGSVVFEVAGKLVPLMQRSFPWIEVMPRWNAATDAALEAADLQLPLGDLIVLAEKVPPAPGFLTVNPDLLAAMQHRYRARFEGKRTIGIAWRSVKPAARSRSFEAPLDQWGPIFDLPNTEIICLQYAPTQEDFETILRRFGRKLFIDPRVDTIDDIGAFAAQIASVDAVVSVANSTVALAHAVGRPAYVPLRCLQDDFRYPHHGEKSYWLPDIKFAWTPPPDRWEVALAELARQVEADWATST